MQKHIVHIYGGMGNQMFQYVFYLNLKSENHHTFINLDFFNLRYSKKAHAQNFALKDAFINLDPPVFGDFTSKALYTPRIHWRLYRIFKKVVSLKRDNRQAFNLISTSNISKRKGNKDMLHYQDVWIDAKYLLGLESEIRDAFQFDKTHIGEKNKKVLAEMGQKESVSIHVRRGDYLKDPYLSSFCKEDYYQKAIQLIKEKVQTPHFFIFSDDIEWCKKTFDDGLPKTFIDWNLHEKSYIDMLLMSNCKHNITAASTFSWWGAWLNNNIGKIVVMPEDWLMFGQYEKQIFNQCIRI